MKVIDISKKLLSSVIILALVISAAPLIHADTTDGLSVSANSAVLIEASTGNIIFEKAAFEKRSMASTTKIMTAIIAIEHADLSKQISISSKAVGIEGSSIYLKTGESLTLENLVYALMLESANDAAAAIAVHIGGSIENFAVMMNEKAKELGLTDTHFTNPHGLDHEDHYTTAYDLAMLTAYALKNETFAKIVSTYKSTIPLYGNEGTRYLLNHNKMLKLYSDSIGVKTGFTKKSGRCLVSAAKRDGVTLIAVTLSAPDDWNDHKAMLNYGFTKYEYVTLAEPGTIKYTIPVVGGEITKIDITNKDGISACLPTKAQNITTTVELKHFYYAPISAGEILGQITFYNNETKIGTIPLTAQHDVPKPQIKSSIWDLFK